MFFKNITQKKKKQLKIALEKLNAPSEYNNNIINAICCGRKVSHEQQQQQQK